MSVRSEQMPRRDWTTATIREAQGFEVRAAGILGLTLSPGRTRSGFTFALREAVRRAGASSEARDLLCESDRLYWDIVLRWRPFAIAYVSGYYGDPGDLVAWALLGIYHAAIRFDPDRGLAFPTYARWWIRAWVVKFAIEKGGPVFIPRGATRQRALRMRAELERAPGLSPAALADRLGCRPDQVEQGMAVLAALQVPVSLDAPFSGEEADGPPLGQTLVVSEGLNPEETFVNAMGATRLHHALGFLSSRERFIVRANFGIDEPQQSLADIGLTLGLSRERVRQLQKRALQILRKILEEEPGVERPSSMLSMEEEEEGEDEMKGSVFSVSSLVDAFVVPWE